MPRYAVDLKDGGAPVDVEIRFQDRARFTAFLFAYSQLRQAAAVPPWAASLAAAIHYPDHWDPAAYDTLESALAELAASFQCTECPPGNEADVNDKPLTTLEQSQFLDAFAGYQYGEEETADARGWFVKGLRAERDRASRYAAAAEWLK